MIICKRWPNLRFDIFKAFLTNASIVHTILTIVSNRFLSLTFSVFTDLPSSSPRDNVEEDTFMWWRHQRQHNGIALQSYVTPVLLLNGKRQLTRKMCRAKWRISLTCVSVSYPVIEQSKGRTVNSSDTRFGLNWVTLALNETILAHHFYWKSV